MAKRGAEEQITKDGPAGGRDNNETHDVSWANSATLSKRKILKPRGKNFSLPSSSNNQGSIFKTATPEIKESNDEKLKALGETFVRAVKKVDMNQGVPDFRPIAKKYLEYYTTIDTSSSTSGLQVQNESVETNSKPVRESQTVPDGKPMKNEDKLSEDDSEEEPKKIIEIQGPKFSIASMPTSKNSPFSFGPKPKKQEIDSDSESEVEIKGPTFTFSKQISDPVFKLAESKPAQQKEASVFGEKPKTNASASIFSSGTFNFGGNFNSTQGDKKDEENSKSNSETVSTKPKAFFNFGASSSDVSKTASPAFNFGASQKPSHESKESEDKVEEEETGGTFTPVVSMNKEEVSQGTGEEGEKVLFQKKAKVMLYEASNTETPYSNLGVGELKILSSLEGKSSRIVVRADGGFRVLLNVSLNAALSYATMGNGSMVRVPSVNQDKSLTTYVLKVKTAKDGEELCSFLNKAKAQ